MIDKISGSNFQNNKQQTLPDSFKTFRLPWNVSDKENLSQQEYQKKLSEEKQTNDLGFRILKFAIATTACFLVAFQGLPKKFRSKLDQIHKNLLDKDRDKDIKSAKEKAKETPRYKDIANLGLGKNKKGISFYVREGARKITTFSKAIFNLGPLKDVLLAKGLEKFKITNKIANGITNVFEKISLSTVRRSYNKTYNAFDIFLEQAGELKKGLSENEQKFVDDEIKNIQNLLTTNFNETARNKRIKAYKNSFDGFNEAGVKIKPNLRDRVWTETYKNLKTFFKKYKYMNFVSENLVTNTKIKNAREIDKAKYQISNSLHSLCDDSYDLLKHIDTFIMPDDQPARDQIKNIATELKKISERAERNIILSHKRSDNAANRKNQTLFKKEVLIESLENLKTVFKNKPEYPTEYKKEVTEYADILIERFEHPQRGAVNEMMKIFEQKFGINSPEYQKLNKLAYKATGRLEDLADLEADKLFDKIRDLKIGSAPKDVLLLAAPLAAIIYGLSKTDNPDEKLSVGIKYGIPIMGAVGVTLLCAVALISTGPSLIMGFFSGLALNQIGTIVDNFIKNHRSKNA